MERIKRFALRAIYPGALVTALVIPAATALLIYVFVTGRETAPPAYAAFALSAYALALVVAQMPRILRGGRALIERNRVTGALMRDAVLRAKSSLVISLAINLAYAAAQLALGFIQGSMWFHSFAAYYAMLALMRFALLRHIFRLEAGANLELELRKYRFCGAILVAIHISLAGIVAFAVYLGRGMEYPGLMIYAVAAFTFFQVTRTAIDLARCRRRSSPVLSAAKAVSFASALVSLFTLETAMLSEFGAEGEELFRTIMTAATGGVVCAIVLGMASYMIVSATKKLETFTAERETPERSDKK